MAVSAVRLVEWIEVRVRAGTGTMGRMGTGASIIYTAGNKTDKRYSYQDNVSYIWDLLWQILWIDLRYVVRSS